MQVFAQKKCPKEHFFLFLQYFTLFEVDDQAEVLVAVVEVGNAVASDAAERHSGD